MCTSWHYFNAEELSVFTRNNCNPVAAKPFQWVYVACLGYTLRTSKSTCSKIKVLHFILQMKTSKLWKSCAHIYSPCSTLAFFLNFLGRQKLSVFSCLSIVTAGLLIQHEIALLNGAVRFNVGNLSSSGLGMRYDWKAARELLALMLRLLEEVAFFDFSMNGTDTVTNEAADRSRPVSEAFTSLLGCHAGERRVRTLSANGTAGMPLLSLRCWGYTYVLLILPSCGYLSRGLFLCCWLIQTVMHTRPSKSSVRHKDRYQLCISWTISV